MPEDTPQVQVTTSNKTSWKKIIITVVVIIVVAGLISGAYWFFVINKSSDTSDLTGPVPKPNVSTATPSATSSTKKDETGDWKTYTGESNGIKFTLKYPPTFFDTGFQWTSSPVPDPEAAGFDNVKGQAPGGTSPLVDGEIRLAIKALTEEESKIYGERIGIARTIEKPTTPATFAGLKALKYSGREPAVEGPNYQIDDGIVMYYVNNQPPVDENSHLIFECIFNPYTDTSLEKTCETIAATFKFLD